MTEAFDPSLSEPYGVVLYTDGSAIPNPGYCGSGGHGYLYKLTETNNPTRFDGNIATTSGYKDKEHVNEGRPVEILRYLDYYASYTQVNTNNFSEVNAVSLFFELCPDVAQHMKVFTLVADSQYVLSGITEYRQKWKTSNWVTSTGQVIKNKEEWVRLDQHLSNIPPWCECKYEWIKGHEDHYGNVRADYLAGMGTNLSTRGVTQMVYELSEPKQYHRPESDLHPFLNLKRVYFNTETSETTPGTYYQTGWSDNNHVEGKRSSDAAYSVVHLKTPDPLLENIIRRHCDLQPEFNSLCYVKLDRLRTPEIRYYLSTYGDLCLSSNGRNAWLNFLDKKPVTVESGPTDIALRSIDVLNHLDQILQSVEKTLELQQSFSELPKDVYEHEVTDITDYFYTKIEKVKKGISTVRWEFLKEHGVGAKQVVVLIGEEKFNIRFGEDIPPRNAMKIFEIESPRIYLVTWKEGSKMKRYATIVKIGEAIGIWSNYYANYLVLP